MRPGCRKYSRGRRVDGAKAESVSRGAVGKLTGKEALNTRLRCLPLTQRQWEAVGVSEQERPREGS